MSLSDILPDNAQGDDNSEGGDDTSGNDNYQVPSPNLSPQSGLGAAQGNVLPVSAQTQAAALGSQALQGGLARGYYQSAVEGLESEDSLMRSIIKSETRALSPPNLIGAGARVVGAGLIGFSVVSAVSQTVTSDNPLQTGLTQTGQLAGSLAGGYAAGEVAAAAATVVGEVVVAVVGVAAAPYVAVGAAVVAVGATIWGSQNGAVAGFQIAEELYEKLSH
jgi:hypothetical protein